MGPLGDVLRSVRPPLTDNLRVPRRMVAGKRHALDAGPGLFPLLGLEDESVPVLVAEL